MVKPFSKSELEAWSDYEQNFDKVTKPEPKNEWGHYGQYELVGNGQVTDPNRCGKFRGFYGCLHAERHDIVTLDGQNHAGEVYVKKIFHSCDSPSCPMCYKSGWAVREAGNIESRIQEASKKFGLAEHIIVSVPQNDYGLAFEKLREKLMQVLRSRFIFGGVYIFHAFRYASHEESLRKNVHFGWYFSPHFHVIGFVDGGYARCRNCKKSSLDCLKCDGFEAQTRRMWSTEGGLNSGYIVKVKAKRKTIFGTAWYQLNHASIVTGSKRTQVARWFGTCSYRRLKLKKGDRIRRDVCPICGEELVRLRYVGAGNPLAEFWIREFWDKFLDERGVPKWVEAG